MIETLTPLTDSSVPVRNGFDQRNSETLELADIVKRIGRLSSQKLANELLLFLKKTVLTGEDIGSTLSTWIKCKEIYTSAFSRALTGLRFRTESVNSDFDSDSGRAHVFYKRDVKEVVCKQLELAQSNQAFFRPFNRNSMTFKQVNKSHLMGTDLAKQVYCCVRSSVMRQVDGTALWVDNDLDNDHSFVGMIQVYTDKTSTTLKSNAIVRYPVHTELLNVTKEFRRYLIDHGHTLAALLPVSASQKEEDEEEAQKGASLGNAPVPVIDDLAAT